MTVLEVAQRYRVHPRTVYRWIKDKKLRAIRPSGIIFITEKDLDAFERKHATEASA